jgi:hypothetical protein
MILEQIYEVDFTDDSFGFRPGRSCHDALKALGQKIGTKRVNLRADSHAPVFCAPRRSHAIRQGFSNQRRQLTCRKRIHATTFLRHTAMTICRWKMANWTTSFSLSSLTAACDAAEWITPPNTLALRHPKQDNRAPWRSNSAFPGLFGVLLAYVVARTRATFSARTAVNIPSFDLIP